MQDEKNMMQEEAPREYRARFMDDDPPAARQEYPEYEAPLQNDLSAHAQEYPEYEEEAAGIAPALVCCTRCGTVLQPHQAFCPVCGQTNRKFCAHCGSPLVPGQPFCHRYGESQQSVPQRHSQPRKVSQPANGLAIPGMVLSIVGLVFSCIPLFGLFHLLPGLILGIVAKIKGNKGKAIAALVCGGIGLVIQLIVLYAVFWSMDGMNSLQEQYIAFNGLLL